MQTVPLQRINNLQFLVPVIKQKFITAQRIMGNIIDMKRIIPIIFKHLALCNMFTHIPTPVSSPSGCFSFVLMHGLIFLRFRLGVLSYLILPLS